MRKKLLANGGRMGGAELGGDLAWSDSELYMQLFQGKKKKKGVV